METLFEVHFTSGLIAKVNAEKTTPKMVFVERGFKCIRREPWVNAYSGFYRTFHEAQKAGKERLIPCWSGWQRRLSSTPLSPTSKRITFTTHPCFINWTLVASRFSHEDQDPKEDRRDYRTHLSSL